MGKKSKSVLPKKIAGVKVPKSIRKGHFGEFLTSPTGQKIVAEAIVAVGAVASAHKAAKSDKAKEIAGAAKDKLADAKDGAGDKASDASGVIAYAIGEAVRSFTDAIRSREERGEAERFHTDDGDAGESKKKPISYEAGPL
jgi:hypothetical protein